MRIFSRLLDSIEYDFRYCMWKIKKFIRIHFDKSYMDLLALSYENGYFINNCLELSNKRTVTISKTIKTTQKKIIIKRFICETEQEFEETKKKAKHICDLLNNL